MSVLATDNQIAMLYFVVTFSQEHGYPPTMREIADGMGYRSVNGAVQQMKTLERKGYVRLVRGVARGIQLTQLGRDFDAGELPERHPQSGAAV